MNPVHEYQYQLLEKVSWFILQTKQFYSFRLQDTSPHPLSKVLLMDFFFWGGGGGGGGGKTCFFVKIYIQQTCKHLNNLLHIVYKRDSEETDLNFCKLYPSRGIYRKLGDNCFEEVYRRKFCFIPPQMKILNMVIPILMRFYSLVPN